MRWTRADGLCQRPAGPDCQTPGADGDRHQNGVCRSHSGQRDFPRSHAGLFMGPRCVLLMTADDPLKTILNGSTQAVLLDRRRSAIANAIGCNSSGPMGRASSRIDQRSFVLRRLEFPVEAFAKAFSGQKIDEVAMVAEFQEAGLGDQVDDAIFRHEIPAKAQVNQWLLPPPLLILGKAHARFRLHEQRSEADRLEIDRGQSDALGLLGHVVRTVPRQSSHHGEALQKIQNNPNVRFLAVSVDAPKTEDKEIKGVLDELNITMPYARDPEQHAGKRFDVHGIPSMWSSAPITWCKPTRPGTGRGWTTNWPRKSTICWPVRTCTAISSPNSRRRARNTRHG